MVDAKCPVCGCDVFTPYAFGIINGSDYPEPQAHLTAFCERCGGILVGRAVVDIVPKVICGEQSLEMTMQVFEFVQDASNAVLKILERRDRGEFTTAVACEMIESVLPPEH